MRKARLFVACCLAAGSIGVATAAPAAAAEPCPSSFVNDYVAALTPPTAGWGPWVDTQGGTITIRGDVLSANAAALVAHYVEATTTFVGCLAADAEILVDYAYETYVGCVLERSAALRANPTGRWIEVGTDLVVKIHYELAIEEALYIASCNGIVYTDPPSEA